MRVTVIGAGVAGLACALELAERGVSVEVLERGARLGA
ncbi:MAG: FAD-dependent oxidoreductase, partial [Gammaproteobacteria bacterium]